MNDKLQEAFYIKDLISQRDQLIFVCSTDNLDNLWNDCADNLPDLTTNNNYNPTYLQLLIGLDNLLKNEDCIEDDIIKVKEYITFSIDQRLEETISLLKNFFNTGPLSAELINSLSINFCFVFKLSYLVLKFSNNT